MKDKQPIINYNKSNTFFNACHQAGIEDPSREIAKMYNDGMSSNHIAEYFYKKYKFKITARGIDYYLEQANVIKRSKKEAKLLAIKKGRMVYHKMPKEEKYKTKQLSAKKRFQVLSRDKYRCTLCGSTVADGAKLEIHHIFSNSSEIDDLKTLCYTCHKGLHNNKKSNE